MAEFRRRRTSGQCRVHRNHHRLRRARRVALHHQHRWTASGFVSGTFDVSEKTWFGSGTVHDVSTLAGVGGTITVDVQGRFVSFTAGSAHAQGVWAITGGTGAYASLSGNGDYDATVNESVRPRIVTESLTGVAEDGASK